MWFHFALCWVLGVEYCSLCDSLRNSAMRLVWHLASYVFGKGLHAVLDGFASDRGWQVSV